MASRVKMMAEITEFYQTNKTAFDECKIKERTFYKWLENLEDYPEVRKVYSWVFKKIYVDTLTVMRVLNFFPTDKWATIKILSPQGEEVQKLRSCVKCMHTIWRSRPFSKRSKGSE